MVTSKKCFKSSFVIVSLGLVFQFYQIYHDFVFSHDIYHSDASSNGPFFYIYILLLIRYRRIYDSAN